MTDEKNPTAKQTCIANVAIKEITRESLSSKVLSLLKQLDKSMKESVVSFNAMRTSFSWLLDEAKKVNADSQEFCRQMKFVACGNFDQLEEEYDDFGKFDVNDEAKFADAVSRLMSITRRDMRMCACLRMEDRIYEAIESWKSKLAKLDERKIGDGSSAAELEIIAMKKTKIEYAIRTLQKRGGTVTDLWYDTVHSLERSISESKRKFHVIHYMEKTGREKCE